MNSCDWDYCHENAICEAEDIYGNTSLKAKCRCNPGYEGDGVNPQWSKSITAIKCIDEPQVNFFCCLYEPLYN